MPDPDPRLNAPSEAFLQTNPFAGLTLLNACSAALGPLTPRGRAVDAADLRGEPGLHQQLIRQELQHRGALQFGEGVDHAGLQQGLSALLESQDPLRDLLAPCAKPLAEGVRALPLHPVVRMLLSAAQIGMPASYRHALRAMALAGALAWHAKAPPALLPRAMLVGLVHDIGEMYVNPEYLSAGRQLDLTEYRQLAAHPHVGAMLLTQLTDYPAEIARAVCEHHERLDGTGYPFQLLGTAISPLGQLMAVAELALGIVDARPHAAQRASFALKFVPGELSGQWAGPITRWADLQPRADEAALQAEATAAQAALAQLGPLDEALPHLQALAERLGDQLDGAAQRVAQRVVHRLHRLRIAWNAMGLWSLSAASIEPQERFDIALAMRELRYRISTIGRDCLWPEADQRVQADARLVPLWLALSKASQPPR